MRRTRQIDGKEIDTRKATLVISMVSFRYADIFLSPKSKHFIGIYKPLFAHVHNIELREQIICICIVLIDFRYIQHKHSFLGAPNRLK